MLPPGPREPAALQTYEWVARPTTLMRRAQARYGEPFTLRLAWSDAPMVFTSDPAEIKRVYAAPPDQLRAGASSAFLEPFAGPRSILVLDGEEHLKERKLMLPPFHGEELQRWRETMARVAHEELAGWEPGRPIKTLERMQAVALEIILRVVFGGGDPRLRDAIRRALAGADADAAGHEPVARQAQRVRGLPAPGPLARRPALRADRPRRRRRDAALRAQGHGRLARAAARPARHAARRGPRDHRRLARLGARAARPPSGGARPHPRRRRGVPRRDGQGGPARAAGAGHHAAPGGRQLRAAGLDAARRACTSRPASTSRTAAPTCGRTRRPSSPSASSTGRPSPTPSSPSAAACAAASAPPSRRWR